MKPWEMRRLVRGCALGTPHKMALMVLATYADASLTCFPGRPALCADTGLSDRRLREVLAELVRAGFLVMDNGGEHTVYRLVLPGENSPEGPSDVGEKSPVSVGVSGEISPICGEKSPTFGEISPILLYKGEEQTKETMKVLRTSAASGLVASEDSKMAELDDPMTSWVNRTLVDCFRFWPGLESAKVLRGVWATWLRHLVALNGRKPSFVTVDMHLRVVRQAFEAAGEDHAAESLTWSMGHSKGVPVVKPSDVGKGGKVVAFGVAERVEPSARLRSEWLSFVRGCPRGCDPLERFRMVFPAAAGGIPEAWVTEAREFLAEAQG